MMVDVTNLAGGVCRRGAVSARARGNGRRPAAAALPRRAARLFCFKAAAAAAVPAVAGTVVVFEAAPVKPPPNSRRPARGRASCAGATRPCTQKMHSGSALALALALPSIHNCTGDAGNERSPRPRARARERERERQTHQRLRHHASASCVGVRPLVLASSAYSSVAVRARDL